MTPQRGPILVIGATGNQGGHVARALLDEGWTVHALTRHADTPKAQALKAQGAHLVTGDMADLPALTQTTRHEGQCETRVNSGLHTTPHHSPFR